jgi:hypothetical protein
MTFVLRISLMTDDQARCAVCTAVLPIARSSAVTWVSGLAATGLGTAVAKTWWGRLLVIGTGLAATAIVDRLARPVCGRCGLAA